jgi:hypothetical protein
MPYSNIAVAAIASPSLVLSLFSESEALTPAGGTSIVNLAHAPNMPELGRHGTGTGTTD